MADEISTLPRAYWKMAGTISNEERERIASLNASNLTPRLERLMRAIGDEADVGPVYAGFYISSFFHAATTATEGGSVILVSDQLFDVTLAVSILIAASAPWSFSDQEAEPDVSADEADQLIHKIVESSVVGTAPVYIDQYELAPPRYKMASLLHGTLLNFVIAHELGHVALGHLKQPTAGVPDRIDLSRWQTEFAADEHAFRAASLAFPTVTTEVQYMGPVILFEIVELASNLLKPTDPAAAADLENYGLLLTHPSAAARRSALITGTHADGAAAELPAVDALVARFRDIRGESEIQVDADDVDRLQSVAAELDVERYNSVLGVGEAVDGVTFLDFDAVKDYVEESYVQARAAIAFAALARIFVGPAKDIAYRLHLGLLHTIYRNTYLQDSSPHRSETERFERLLAAVAPDIIDVEFETWREIHGQVAR